MPRAGEHDRRLAVGRELFELARNVLRIEQQQLLAVVDQQEETLRAPRLARLPGRVRGLPVPEARP